MAYMALYRKWRPRDFDEVRGQDAIVRTLRNQILYHRIGHAYLFCGTRGTGKTSIAKLFAKAVNCQNPIEGNPCNACPSCQAINAQNSLDVIEIDAASNNGVDHIREIREQVQYSPVEGRYKVYIIDEVHMLSTGAFNALLKTLEEPPSYVIFILATTEKHKIPVTILSRCQKYDFKRISIDTITDHLSDLMEKEGVEAEKKALSYIARAADGSMRDALSLLDQCISFYLGQALTYDNVLEVLGTVDVAVFRRLLDGVLKNDCTDVLRVIDGIVAEGRELSQFLSDFLWYLRNLLILKDQDGYEGLDMSSENIALLREDAARIDTEHLLRCIRVLSDLAAQLRNATQKRVLLEVGFIRLCTPQMETDSGSLLLRLRALEERMEKGIPIAAATANAETAAPAAQPTAQRERLPEASGDPTEALRARFTPAEAADLEKIAAGWKKIVSTASMPMQTFLKEARVAVSHDSALLQLIFPEDGLAKHYFENDHGHNLAVLSDLVAQHTGKTARFECIAAPKTPTADTDYIDLSKIHHPIIFE